LKMMFYETGIDILINNACQTIRRPTGYYIPVIEKEQSLWDQSDDIHKDLLKGCFQFEQIRRQILMEHNKHHRGSHDAIEGGLMSPQLLENCSNVEKSKEDVATNDEILVENDTIVTTDADNGNHSSAITTTHFERTGLTHSAAMSQMILLPEDVGVNDTILPPGVTDVNGQQLDLRTTNSWLLRMEEISTPELMECMFINAIAPFVLNSRLKPLMALSKNKDERPDRYIINVSAMEGKV
jgi:hypothetical protein